jgi:hypothetical protein
MKKHLISALLIMVAINSSGQTIGLLQHSAGTDDNGYVLFAPNGSTTTYLIDKCGKSVHQWPGTYRPGLSVYLTNDGYLLRPGNVNNANFVAGGQGGIIQKIDWTGTVVWSYQISDASQCQHHDIKQLPNGNILAIAWDNIDSVTAVGMGRNPSQIKGSVWSEKIIELQPSGTNGAAIVWEWKLRDHLIQDVDIAKPGFGVVSDHPELLNLNYTSLPLSSDWIHLNSIDYNAALDQVMISSHNLNEIWIIDHSTTTAQAAAHTGGNRGKGGDFLYRWGNPTAYNRGVAADKKLFGQHNAQWIGAGLRYAGNIMIFNNGLQRPAGNYSSIDIINQPVDVNGNYTISSGQPFGPTSLVWTYQDPAPTNFYAQLISSCQMLPNGNVLICNGPAGNFFEIDSNKNTLWRYVNPVATSGVMSQGATPAQNSSFRCTQYSSGFAGFSGQTLSPGQPIELNPINYSCALGVTDVSTAEITITPNPFSSKFQVQMPEAYKKIRISIFEFTGQLVYQSEISAQGKEINIDFPGALPSRAYIIKIFADGASYYQKIIKE